MRYDKEEKAWVRYSTEEALERVRKFYHLKPDEEEMEGEGEEDDEKSNWM